MAFPVTYLEFCCIGLLCCLLFLSFSTQGKPSWPQAHFFFMLFMRIKKWKTISKIFSSVSNLRKFINLDIPDFRSCYNLWQFKKLDIADLRSCYLCLYFGEFFLQTLHTQHVFWISFWLTCSVVRITMLSFYHVSIDTWESESIRFNVIFFFRGGQFNNNFSYIKDAYQKILSN